jgi:energy-coupling factor transport system ATP-binding protein
MLGMIPIEHGAITVAGQSVTHGRTRELAGLVGYLPQDPARLLFAETVSEELAASTRYLRNPSTARNASELLDELDIGHLAHRHPRDLSAGERERVALAAVLIASPGVLVLDEPTRGMDGTRKRNLMLLLERERERGTAIIMATHDVELVAQFADRVILIGNGDIIADDCPASVLSGSVTFSPQMNRLFGGSILTVDDALTFLHQHPIAIP